MSDSAFLERSQNRQDVVPAKWLIERLESPDVAIVDVAMKELNGIEATAQIIRRSPTTTEPSPTSA